MIHTLDNANPIAAINDCHKGMSILQANFSHNSKI